MVSSYRLWTSVCVLSAFSFAASVTFLLIFPSIYHNEIAKKTNLVEGTFLYPIWRDLPLPIYKRLHFFNITNAEEFLKNGTKMAVDEIGPYTYLCRWIKEDMQFFPEGTVSYREVKTCHFVREESVGGEDEEIYSLNGPYIVAADYLRNSISSIKIGANMAFRFLNEKLVIKKSIKELAFGGYKDPIMKFSKYFRWDSPFRKGKFSWLTGHNATDDGLFEVSTGGKDHSSLNMIKKFNGDSYLDYWKNDSCNEIKGTNAEFSPPVRDEQTEYTFFQPIFCRPITFRGKSTVIHKGVKTRRFENHEDIFSKENPDNSCFDISPELASGVLDVSPCQFGAPVVLSFPHFYLADSSYLENIEGLAPNKQNHGSHIDAEILTGVTVDLSIKFQMNVRLQPDKHLTAFENATAGVYPIFWIDLYVALPNDLIDTIHYQLFRPAKIVHGLLAFVMVLSVIFFTVSLWKKRRELPCVGCYGERRSELEWDNFQDERRSLIDSDSYFFSSHTDYSELWHSTDGSYHSTFTSSVASSTTSYTADSPSVHQDVSKHVQMSRMKIPKRCSKSKKRNSGH